MIVTLPPYIIINIDINIAYFVSESLLCLLLKLVRENLAKIQHVLK